MKTLTQIGIDSWSRPVFRDTTTGTLYVDVNLGETPLDLHTVANNELDGEPDMPIKGEWAIVSA